MFLLYQVFTVVQLPWVTTLIKMAQDKEGDAIKWDAALWKTESTRILAEQAATPRKKTKQKKKRKRAQASEEGAGTKPKKHKALKLVDDEAIEVGGRDAGTEEEKEEETDVGDEEAGEGDEEEQEEDEDEEKDDEGGDEDTLPLKKRKRKQGGKSDDKRKKKKQKKKKGPSTKEKRQRAKVCLFTPLSEVDKATSWPQLPRLVCNMEHVEDSVRDVAGVYASNAPASPRVDKQRRVGDNFALSLCSVQTSLI